MEAKVHEGRNVKRFREMLGIKQDALAYELGEGWNQQKKCAKQTLKIGICQRKEQSTFPHLFFFTGHNFLSILLQ